jgi:uncharacterized protein (TIGR00730 family)
MTAPVITVFGASQIQPDHPDYRDAVRLGKRLAQAGYTVATGGYGGLMEAVSAGAAEAGGHIVGVTAPSVFPGRSGANPHIVEERPAATITERIHDLLTPADAVVALPGSIGTFTELMVAWNLAIVAELSDRRPPPIFAVGTTWSELVPYLSRELETEADLVECVATVDEAADFLIGLLGVRN